MPHRTVGEVMTPNPVALPASATLADAARAMRDANIGDVLVLEDGRFCGIVTDRDIVVRAVAEERNLDVTGVGDICSRALVTLTPSDTTEAAVRVMREHAIRRLPVLEGDRPVGVVSIGDLAADREPQSALGKISEAPPNR